MNAKQVKTVSGSKLSATAKRHLLAGIEANKNEYFGVRIKVTNIKMLIEKLEDNNYKVTVFNNHLSMISNGTYETSSTTIVEVK